DGTAPLGDSRAPASCAADYTRRSPPCKPISPVLDSLRDMSSPGEDSLVCRCFVVSEDVIRRAIDEHQLHQVEEVTACTKAGGGCSSCWDDIQAILSEIRGKPLPRNVPDGSGLSSAQKRALIVKTIEENVQRSEEHTSELQSRVDIVCRLLL